MSTQIILFSAHLKLESLQEILAKVNKNDDCIFLTPHMLFPYETEYIRSLHSNSKFVSFADILTDKEMENIDDEADDIGGHNVWKYYDEIKLKKNEYLVKKVNSIFKYETGYILCDDLGIVENVWIDNGFKKVIGEYYYIEEKNSPKQISSYRRIRTIISNLRKLFNRETYVSLYEGKKYVFYGKLNRIAYRFNINFKRSKKEQYLRGLEMLYIRFFNKSGFNRNIKRITTFHEYQSIGPHTNLTIIQDGYLPPNYTSHYMKYYEGNISFYAWDKMGMGTFINQNLPGSILPFRKKLLLPQPKFPTKIKKVLCVTSGAGDWTALKNRSDEDRMVLAFAKIASMYPDIEFIYRCHPVWVIPQHQGVNSIDRVAKFFEYLGLPNLHLSSNIPSAYNNGQMVLSYKRSSLEEDLKDVDLVFGEHSISMIDAAFKNIIFASVNMTGRRDLFKGVTDLGFPHCESLDEIKLVIDNISSKEFSEKYLDAVNNYNEMTLIDET